MTNITTGQSTRTSAIIKDPITTTVITPLVTTIFIISFGCLAMFSTAHAESQSSIGRIASADMNQAINISPRYFENDHEIQSRRIIIRMCAANMFMYSIRIPNSQPQQAYASASNIQIPPVLVDGVLMNCSDSMVRPDDITCSNVSSASIIGSANSGIIPSFRVVSSVGSMNHYRLTDQQDE